MGGAVSGTKWELPGAPYEKQPAAATEFVQHWPEYQPHCRCIMAQHWPARTQVSCVVDHSVLSLPVRITTAASIAQHGSVLTRQPIPSYHRAVRTVLLLGRQTVPKASLSIHAQDFLIMLQYVS